MTILILHEGATYAIGESFSSIGRDCKAVGEQSPIYLVDDADKRIKYLCRALELIEKGG